MWTYLPMKITDKSNAQQLIQGHIPMQPVAVISDAFYPATSKEKELRVFIMNKLCYDPEQNIFLKCDPRMTETGEIAVVFTNPAELLKRLINTVQCYGNAIYDIGMDEVCYLDNPERMTDRHILCRKVNQAWKKEVLLFTRLSRDIRLQDENTSMMPDMLDVGDLSDIAVMVSGEELLQGNYPEQLKTADLSQYMKEIQTESAGITQNHIVLFGDMAEIEPIQKWITFYQNVFPAEEWEPITIMQQTPAGQSIPRLSFPNRDCVQKVFFFYEKVQLNLTGDKNEIEALMKRFMNVHQEAGLSHYTRVGNVFVMNLGPIEPKYDYKLAMEAIHKERIREENWNIEIYQRLALASRRERNVFGMDVAVPRWWYMLDYSIELEEERETDLEDEVIRLWHYTWKMAEQRFIHMMEGEDVYAAFHRI